MTGVTTLDLHHMYSNKSVRIHAICAQHNLKYTKISVESKEQTNEKPFLTPFRGRM